MTITIPEWQVSVMHYLYMAVMYFLILIGSALVIWLGVALMAYIMRIRGFYWLAICWLTSKANREADIEWTIGQLEIAAHKLRQESPEEADRIARLFQGEAANK